MGTELKEARRWLKEQLPAGARLLCAVSGGRDSMVLLHLLCSCGFDVTAAHLHHGLRGQEADRDQMFVRDYCKKHDIPFRTKQVDVGEFAAREGLGVEEAARQVRYEFLAATALQLEVTAIATGHQLEDQAETILLNLTRGTGADGLRGIARRRGMFIRPLLLATREEIADYAAAHGVPSVEDGSNRNLIYSRNRIRHRVLPELERINPSFCQTISRTAHILAEESHLLDRMAAGLLTARETEDGLAVDYAAFREAEEVLRRRMARLLVGRMAVGRKDFSAVHFDAVANIGRGDCLILPHGLFAAVEGEELIIGTLRAPPPPVELIPGGETEWNGWRYTCRWSDREAPEGEECLSFADDQVALPLIVGAWHSRDRMVTATGQRTLKRLFADCGIPVHRRGEVPVLYSQGKVVGAFGIGVDPGRAPAPGRGRWIVSRRKKEHFEYIKEKEHG